MHAPKQKKITFKPRIKLNHNMYNSFSEGEKFISYYTATSVTRAA